MNGQRAFWTDDRYDRERARGGAGRYAERLRDNVGEFGAAWGDIAPVEFACAAWRVATPPLTSPGYVRWHRRVLSATCVRNTWDGSLTARVRLVSPPPPRSPCPGPGGATGAGRAGPRSSASSSKPAEQDLAKAPHLRASLEMDAPVPLGRLPAAPDGLDGTLEETAHRALVVLVGELNELLAPIIAQLERPPS